MSKHDLGESGNSVHGLYREARMHGPEGVAFTNRIFNHVEEALGLPANTVKIGIMDEERRTSLNLGEYPRREIRVAFINTGFDRTGDEIRIRWKQGPSCKDDIKKEGWIAAYEALNVDIGLECGLQGKAWIVRAWAMPDMMEAMLDQRSATRNLARPVLGAKPDSGDTHALHYHKVDVMSVQNGLKDGGRRAAREDIMQIPWQGANWSPEQIANEG